MVNWDTKLKSAVSDLEVTSSNELGKLWTIKYKVGDKFIEIATTRPETLLGDTAVAVNPSDERYKELIGQTVTIPSYHCTIGEIIKSTSAPIVEHSKTFGGTIPSHVSVDKNNATGKVERNVTRSQIALTINELLIIEYYSRK